MTQTKKKKKTRKFLRKFEEYCSSDSGSQISLRLIPLDLNAGLSYIYGLNLNLNLDLDVGENMLSPVHHRIFQLKLKLIS